MPDAVQSFFNQTFGTSGLADHPAIVAIFLILFAVIMLISIFITYWEQSARWFDPRYDLPKKIAAG